MPTIISFIFLFKHFSQSVQSSVILLNNCFTSFTCRKAWMIMKDKILAAHAYYSKVNNFIVLLKYFVHSQKKKKIIIIIIIQNYIIYIKITDYERQKLIFV